jgi:prepilin-type N-terminal cleavage/methylation domain-containing protein
MNHRPRDGFTLIELLVVMGIMAVLMGLLIPAISLVRRQAKITKAKEQIEQIRASCSLYRDANGVYPSWDPSTSAWMTADGATNSEGLRQALATVAPDLFRTATSMNDPWQNKIRYRPARVYEFDAGKNTTKPIAGDDPAKGVPPNIESYQVWSTGPDGQDQIGDDNAGDGDDIPNWKKQ